MKNKLYWLYVSIYFIIPGFLIYVLNIPYGDTYNIKFNEIIILQLSFYIITIGAIIFFFNEKRVYYKKPVFKELTLLLILFSPAYLFYSIVFFLDYGISFRQVNRLEEVSLLMKIILISMQTIIFVILYLLHYLRSQQSLIFKSIFFLYVFSLILTSNAAFDYAILLIVVLCFFKIDLYLNNVSRLKLFILVPLFMFISFFSIVFIGVSNKIGTDVFWQLILGADDYSFLYNDLILRQSVNLVSAGKAIDDTSLIGDFNFFNYIFENFKYVLSRTFALKAEINTFPRINYFKIFNGAKDTSIAGASPGFIATLLYIPLFLPSLLIGSFLFSLIVRIWKQLTKSIEFNFFSIIIFLFCFVPIIDSLFSLFLVLDFNFFNFLLICFLYKRT